MTAKKSIVTTKAPTGWDKAQIKLGASFLQSGKWGEFQAIVGSKPHYLAGAGWSCLLLERRTPFGMYLFAPYGPTVDSSAELDGVLDELKSYGRRVGAGWLRVEPMSATAAAGELTKTLAGTGGRRSVHNSEPALTRTLDITPPTDKLLAGISQSTRSLIRKNQRENFMIFRTSSSPDDLTGFARMLQTVADRKGIGFFPAGYFIKQAEVLMPAKMMYLEQAYHGKKLVGQALMHDYGGKSSYTFAASLPEARKLSVSALLLWQAIVNAKARGNKIMDLYGTAPDDAPPSHPWYGFSSYKKKFGGQVVEYSGTWDIPLSVKYKLYRGAARGRLLWRH